MELLRVDQFENTISFSVEPNEPELELKISTEYEYTYFQLSDEQVKALIDILQTYLVNKIKKP